MVALAVARFYFWSNAFAATKEISETIDVEYKKPFDDLIIGRLRP